MMKRLLLFLMVAIVVTVAAPLSVSAAESSITDDEVCALVNGATNLFNIVYQDSSDYVDANGTPLMLERNGRTLEYLPAKSEFSEFSYWENLAKSIYTDDIYPYALEHGKDTENILGLLINYNGNAYFLKNTPVEFDASTEYKSCAVSFRKYSEVGTEPYANCGLWIENRNDTTAKGGVLGSVLDGKYMSMATSIELTAEFVKTSSGWRISKGTMVDYFAPNHVSERSGKIGIISNYAYYPFMYDQIAKQVIEEFLSDAYGKEITINHITVTKCNHISYLSEVAENGKVVFPKGRTVYGEVVVSSAQINDNKKFSLTLISNGDDESWVVDLDKSVKYGDDLSATMEAFAKDFGTIDQTPVIELYNSRNPDTADVAPSVVAVCVFLLMLSVLVDKRKWIFG